MRADYKSDKQTDNQSHTGSLKEFECVT